MRIEFAEWRALRIRTPPLKSYQSGCDGATRRHALENQDSLIERPAAKPPGKPLGSLRGSPKEHWFGSTGQTDAINDQDAELGLGSWISVARESLIPLCERGNLTRKIVPVSPVCSTDTVP
jgi:hypothetical protein